MTAIGHDSLETKKTLTVDGKAYEYFSLPEAAAKLGDISKLPEDAEGSAGERAALRERRQLHGG